MPERFIDEYIDKLILLEKSVGANVSYRLFEPPPPFAPHNPLEINRTAGLIARFVGVKDLITVAVTTHAEDTGGHIDLGNSDPSVFIEVASDLLDFPLCVAATLAHEISHKYLHLHDVSWGRGPEFRYHNEVLTDITAVFLGLGKLLLNGCTGERRYDLTQGGKRVTRVEKKTVGYLSQNQLAFVYLITCAMRRIPETVYEAGLLPAARASVRNCAAKYRNRFFNSGFHGDAIREELQASLRSTHAGLSGKLELCKSKLSELNDNVLAKISSRIAESRNQTHLSPDQAENTAHDPALAYLSNVKLGVEIEREIGSLHRYSQEADADLDTIRALLDVAAANAIKLGSGPPGRFGRWLGRLRHGLKQSMKRAGINHN